MYSCKVKYCVHDWYSLGQHCWYHLPAGLPPISSTTDEDRLQTARHFTVNVLLIGTAWDNTVGIIFQQACHLQAKTAYRQLDTSQLMFY